MIIKAYPFQVCQYQKSESKMMITFSTQSGIQLADERNEYDSQIMTEIDQIEADSFNGLEVDSPKYFIQSLSILEKLFNKASQSGRQINIQECPKIMQKNPIRIYDKALDIKNNFLKQFDILQSQIQQFEDQHYVPNEIYDQFHPNFLAEKCLDRIQDINAFMEKTIKKIDQTIGNTIRVRFYYMDSVQRSAEFESVRTLKYLQKMPIYNQDKIVAYDFSFQDKLLACCSNYFVAIFDLIQFKKTCQIPKTRQITAIKYTQDEEYNFMVGDIGGYVSQYNSYTQQQLFEHKLHDLTICQILIKDEHSIFTCSLDNTIKLTNIQQIQTQMVINQSFSCFSGFDYSYTQDFIIAPKNSTYLSLWDCKTEKEIISQNHEYLETLFIAIQLSSDSKQVLVNLYDKLTILLFDIQLADKELVLIKQMKLHNEYEKCVNLQWCLDDTSFIYFHSGSYDIRNVKQKKIPLIYSQEMDKEQHYLYERGFVNKLNKELNFLVAIYRNQVYIYQRKIEASLAK